MTEPILILYDSDCATCHGLVRFLLARGKAKRERFRFAPLEALYRPRYSEARDHRGQKLSGQSVVVLKDGVALQRSEAVFCIARTLGLPWNSFSLLRLVPLSISNVFYDLFAKHRYRLFGKADPKALCEIPESDVRGLFLEEIPEGCLFMHQCRETV